MQDKTARIANVSFAGSPVGRLAGVPHTISILPRVGFPRVGLAAPGVSPNSACENTPIQHGLSWNSLAKGGAASPLRGWRTRRAGTRKAGSDRFGANSRPCRPLHSRRDDAPRPCVKTMRIERKTGSGRSRHIFTVPFAPRLLQYRAAIDTTEGRIAPGVTACAVIWDAKPKCTLETGGSIPAREFPRHGAGRGRGVRRPGGVASCSRGGAPCRKSSPHSLSRCSGR